MMNEETAGAEPLSRHDISKEPAASDAARPSRQTLGGRWTRLEPLDPASHCEELFTLSHAPHAGPDLWAFMGYGPFESRSEMRGWLDRQAALDDPLFFAIRDSLGRAAGMASYLRIEPAHGSIEMGHIWLGPPLQKTREGTEALYLMMRLALETLRFRRLEWKCDAANAASRRAARRLGFSYEGTFYRHMIVKGLNRDTAWYALLAEDWAPIAAAFEAWLSPDNFDPRGRQRRALNTATA